MNMSDAAIPQLDEMRMGVDYVFKVTLRGYSVALRPLSVDELLLVGRRVNETLNDMPEAARARISQETMYAKTILQEASTDFGKANPRLTAGILGKCTEAELSFLLKEYVAGCDACDPRLESMTRAKLDALVDQVKKNVSEAKGSADPHYLRSQLIELSFMDTVNLCMELLRQAESPTAS